MTREYAIEEAVYLPNAGSTNDEALNRLEAGSSNCLVWTLNQTHGRGSRGRDWIGPANHVLAVSIGLHGDSVPDPRSFCYPLFTGVLLYHCLLGDGMGARIQFPPLRLKWPNDLLLHGRKLAGILCETRWSGRVRSLVLGMGINLEPHPELDRLPKGYACLSDLPSAPGPETLVVRLRVGLPEILSAMDGWETLNREWLRHCLHPVGAPLSLVTEGERLDGVFAGLDKDGNFLVEALDGTRRVVSQACEDFRILEAK